MWGGILFFDRLRWPSRLKVEKFALWFVGRSGSSFLRGMIDSHPQGCCAGEILWRQYRNETDVTVAQALDDIVKMEGVRASGFKCPYEHLYEMPAVMEFLTAHNFKVLRLYRRNKLDQYLSMRLAQENGKWTSLKGRYDIHRVEIDPDHFLRVGAGFLDADERLKESSKAFVSHAVSYEGLVSGKEWRDVCNFLSLSRKKVESPFKRQRELTQREAILNYDELKERCRNTFAEHYFD